MTSEYSNFFNVTDKKAKKKRGLFFWKYVVLILILSVLLTGTSVLRHVSVYEDVSNSRVAIMASNTEVMLDPICGCPGKSTILPITIANYEGSRICEVAQAYKLTVTNMSDNIPIQWAFYDNQACVGTPVLANGRFDAGAKCSETYYLKITWPETDEDGNVFDYRYSLEIDALRVLVVAEQIS